MSLLDADQRRAQIEAALAQYPHIDAETIDQIKTWFNKDASALDVALLASDQNLAEAYRKFRADHADGFSASDVLWAGAIIGALALPIVAIVWFA